MKTSVSIRLVTQVGILLSIIIVDYCHAQNTPSDYLAAHNSARAAVGVGPLVWDQTVASYAQQYANQRTDCQLVHSNTDAYGENIAQGYGSYGALTGVDGVKLWINEKWNYSYSTNTCKTNAECGHYTQLVWRESLRLGCARVLCKNGGAFITCNYDPPGNYIGERPY